MDVRGWGAALVDLVLPAECGGCAEPPSVGAWCARCAAKLGPASWIALPGGPAVLAAGRYTGPLRTALLRYKERGRRDLAVPLARHLRSALDEILRGAPGPDARAAPSGRWAGGQNAPPAQWAGGPGEPSGRWPGAAGAVGPGVTWLVPAPSRPAAARARGGDHVLRLARALAADRPDVRVAPALALARRTRDSVGLDAAQRAANLEGRLRVRDSALPSPGSGVVLLDDVVTTGATLRACRAALWKSGIRAGPALVLCDATSGRDDHERTRAS